jgi:hypothetical protein
MEDTLIGFPKQRIATARKTQKWGKECVRAALQITDYHSNDGLRKELHRKIVNYDLANGIINPEEIEQLPVPDQGVDGALQDHPLVIPRLNLLTGEASRRKFDWTIRAINSDAISRKEKQLKEDLTNIINRTIKEELRKEQQNGTIMNGSGLSPEAEANLKQELKDFERYKNYEFQDIRERMSQHILEYLWRQQNLKEKFTRGFEDALIAAEEIYCVDDVAGEPILRKASPLNIKTIGGGESIYIEDCDVIIEENEYSMGQIIDMYYEYLKPEWISAMEENKSIANSHVDSDIVKRTRNLPLFPSAMFEGIDDSTGGGLYFPNAATSSESARDSWSESQVTLSRVVWRSLRKLGIKKYLDEDGRWQKEIVDENYKVKTELGEKVKWYWVIEWWEGHNARWGQGRDSVDSEYSVYFKIRPRPIQFRRLDNFSAAGSGYCGTIYNIDLNRGRSLLDIVKPYQYMYNMIMERLKKAFKAWKLPKIELDLSKIPDNWDLDKWMYYSEELNYVIVDSFKQGDKGSAQGKLAGSFNTTGKSYEMRLGDYIQQHVQMLEYIERQVGLMTGLTEQRMGNVEKRETVGGIERSVMQSTSMTEKLFMLHENTKIRAMKLLLETAKYLWRNERGKKVQYVLDDLSTKMLNINMEQVNEDEMGIFVSNTDADNILIQTLKTHAQELARNQAISMSDLMKIYLNQSVSQMRRELERAEQERFEREDQKRKDDKDVAIANIEAELKDKEAERQLKIDLQQMKIDGDKEVEKMKLEAEKLNNELEEEKLEETIRHNKETEKISKAKPTNTKK